MFSFKLPQKYRKVVKWMLWTIAILCLIPVLFFISVYCGAFGKLYTKEELKRIQNYEATEVYSEEGNVLGKYYWENRSNIAYQDAPPFLVNALIATEDARFYEHNGVDFIGLLRVFFKTLVMGDKRSGGGSTISQQLSKNIFGREDYGLLSLPVNKIKEGIHAVRLHQVYTQEEILVLYLNTVSVGEDTYGVKNAALRFFSKPPDSLTIEESAVLIGMLKSPTAYNPRLHPDNAIVRRNVVLDNMAAHNYISETEADSLKALPLTLHYKNMGVYGEVAPYFLRHIEEQATSILDTLKNADGEKYNLYIDGLKIYTTLNYQMQEYALAAAKEHMQTLQSQFSKQWASRNPWGRSMTLVNNSIKNSKRYKALAAEGMSYAEIMRVFKTPVEMEIFDWEGGHKVTLSPLDSIIYALKLLQTGFLAMEPNTGAIKVWVGGDDYNFFQYDHIKSTRQIGSTFKPIVYATAVEQGVSPCEYIENEQHVYEQFNGWSPGNADGKYGGKYSLKGALSNSVNVVSVEVLLRAGIDNVIRTARRMGIKSEIPRVPSIALGVADISLMEMVTAYCAFPNGGRAVQPVSITKIEDGNGNVIWAAPRYRGKQAFTRQTAYYMTEMLKGVVNEGTASRIRYTYNLKGDIAGKTGTTQSQADGWFIGYTPGLVAGAWVGAESPAVHFNSITYGQGAAMALPIWALFMQKCKADKQCTPYVTGNFHFGNDLYSMPECESFIEDSDNIFDKLKHLFGRKKDKNSKEPSSETKKEDKPQGKKRKWFNIFGH